MITVHICSERDRSIHLAHGMSSGYCIPGRNAEQTGGFSVLKHIDESVIDPGISFDRHSHRDVEILTYIVDGCLDYRDDLGHREQLLGGEVQVVQAGDGMSHSEANASHSEPLHVVQGWLRPAAPPTPETRYQQRYIPDDAKLDKLCLIASREPQGDALSLSADVNVYAAVTRPGEPLLYYRPEGRRTWLQVVRGSLMLNDVPLSEGDAAAVEGDHDASLRVLAQTDSEFLLFDLP